MARLSLLVLAVALAASMAHGHTDVTPAEVKAMIDAGGPLTVLDVREDFEFCDSTSTPPGHIPGAVNMPWNSGYLQDHYDELPIDEDIVVVCRSGNRSDQASDFLDGLGFTSVFDMLGGMRAWGYETELCSEAGLAGGGDPWMDLALHHPSPNPFGAQTEIAYTIPSEKGTVTLAIYDTRGRLVTRLVDQPGSAGTHRAVWKGTDRHGRPVSSGVYFSRLTWNGRSRMGRVTLAR
jgi:rhodanese-related sulfurtransferase